MTSAEITTTGPYTHIARFAHELRFPSTGDVDRSFTVLIASHVTDDPEDRERQGIAILDNDNDAIVVDGISGASGPGSPAMVMRFEFITQMDWREFSDLCRQSERYRSGIPDIDDHATEPRPGNLARQAELGFAIPPSDDTRSSVIRALSSDPEVPYKFPPSNRETMTAEICNHPMFVENNGLKIHIGWDIRMNSGWNRTGRIRGYREMNSRHDSNWRHTVDTESSIVKKAARRALAPYFQTPSSILDMDEFPCEFVQVGKRGGFLILKKFCGYFMSATRDISISDRLLRLDDEQLEALWVICRVLDADLSRVQRNEEMAYQMHRLRCDYELGRDLETA